MSHASASSLRDEVAQLAWYHTFDLPGGVTTPGYYDLRGVVDDLPIPSSLAGRRCLDVASADGFFAVEMARRGGDVVSIDLADTTRQDWQGPPGANDQRRLSTGRAAKAFVVVTEALGLSIERHDLSVYDVSVERLGRFDYVFMGNILMHLADPARALRAVRSVLHAGELLSFEGVSMPLTVLRPFTPSAQLWHTDDARWRTHNYAGHKRLVEAGGFGLVASRFPLFQPLGAHFPAWPRRRPRSLRDVTFWLATRRVGATSSWVRAEPRDLA